MDKKDIYQEITNRIIKDLEEGTPVWEKPWENGFTGFPKNEFSKCFYSGINTIILWTRQGDIGADSSQWVTFRQAQNLGGQIKKGEKASRIIFYKKITVPEHEEEKGEKQEKQKGGNPKQEKKKEEGNSQEKEISIIKPHPVFNLSQTKGLEHLVKAPDEKEQTFKDEKEAEELLKKVQAKIKLANFSKAFYTPSEDKISMPRKSQFKTKEGFYSTLFHELSHWTGHPSRLNREINNKFGTKAYAFEELVAEISASFLCCHFGFRYSTQHSAYVKSWVKLLKEDKKAIFKASSLAQKATQFILGNVQGEIS